MNNIGLLQKTKVSLLRRFYRMLGARTWRGHNPQVEHRDIQAGTSEGEISMRIYQGESAADKPLVVYFHGGGWVLGSLESHHPFCQSLCEDNGCTVISVDYRLAPENLFPAAHDDCLAATDWVAENIDEFGPSNGKMVLAGDSAGANLATATCLALSPGVCRCVIGEIIIYPVTDHYESAFASYVDKASGYSLSSKMMCWFWDIYLGNSGTTDLTEEPERAMPLKATGLSTLPPTLLVTAENDPLRDEGIAYAEKLRDAGVAIQYRHFEDAAHGFACSEGPTVNFNAFMNDMVKWLHHLEAKN